MSNAGMYSLTGIQRLNAKWNLLRETNLIPAIVIHDAHDLDTTLRHCETFVSRVLIDFHVRPIIHLPFRGLELANDDPEVEVYSRSLLLKITDAVCAMRPECILMHSFIPSSCDPSNALLDRLIENLRPIVDHTHQAGVELCIENTFEISVLPLAVLVRSLAVDVILDIPRIQAFSKDTPAEWLRELGPIVNGLHIYGPGFDDGHEELRKEDRSWVISSFRVISNKRPKMLLDVPRESLAQSSELLRSWFFSAEFAIA